MAGVWWLVEVGDVGGDSCIECGLEGDALGMISLGSGLPAA